MLTYADQGRLLVIVVFISGYITARFSLITQAIDLAYFAWDHGVVVSLLLLHFFLTPGALLPTADFVRRDELQKAF